MPTRRTYLAAAVVASLGLTAGPAARAASAAVVICVPTTAGAAVTSGGADGSSCGAAKPVELPDSRTDQMTLLSVLPYLSVNGTGVGGKPTIVVKGANVQLVNGAGTTTTANGAGNLILGYNESPGTQTGSHNIITGQSNSFQSYGSLVGGTNNKGLAPWSTVLGYSNTASGNYSAVLGGYRNTTSNFGSVVAAGHENAARGHSSAILGGNNNGTEGDAATVVGGYNNVGRASESSVLGGNSNTAAGKWSTMAGGKLNITNAVNGTGDGTHYWVRVKPDGTKAADSGNLRGGYSIETYDYTGGWTLVWFRGIDTSKCSISAEPDASYDTEIGYRYLTGEYVYVQVKRAGVGVDGVGLSVSLDCPNPAA